MCASFYLNVCMRERERNKEVYLIAGLSKERNIGQNKILKGKIEREKEKYGELHLN